MSFFRNYPIVNYKFGNETAPALFQNLSVYIDIIDTIRDDITVYENHYIQDGSRPDVLSYELYGTIDFYWTFFFLNEKLRIQGWPMNSSEVAERAKKFYPNTVITTEATMHGEFFVGDIIADRFDNGESSPDEFGLTYKAKIIEKNYDLGQLIVAPIIDVKSIAVTNGGSGYTKPPTITISGGSGAGATAQAIMTYVDGNGDTQGPFETIQSIAVTNGGNDYDATPTVTISAPDIPRGTQATAVATLSTFLLPNSTTIYSQPNQPDVLLWDEESVRSLITKNATYQYNAPHHYVNSAGERQDLTILTGGGVRAGSSLTKVSYTDRLQEANENLRRIKVFKPEVVSQISNEYQKLLRR